MNEEGYVGLGRRKRRIMRKIWKATAPRTSLKMWARTAETFDLAHVWIRTKQPSKGE
jgi:hypothetical protein